MPEPTLSDQQISPANPDQFTPPADPGSQAGSPASSSPPFDPRMDAMERQIIEMRRQNELILKAMERSQPAAPPANDLPPVSTEEFLKDPTTHIARIMESKLDSKLKATIEPLQRFADSYRRREEYEVLKSGFRTRYGQAFRDVEDLVDGVIQASPNAVVNEATMQQAFALAVGSRTLGWAGQRTAAPAAPPVAPGAANGPPGDGRRVTPPASPPTAPAAPGSPQRAAAVNLSDIERRLKNTNPKTRSMTDEEYAALSSGQSTSEWLTPQAPAPGSQPVLDQTGRR